MTFSEVIKVLDGQACNLAAHRERMQRTARHFGFHAPRLEPAAVQLPGLVKWRVVYGADGILSTEFAPYAFRRIDRAAIVHDEAIRYPWKSTDRGRLDALREASGCDEVLIFQRGLLTDASFANVVVEDTAGALFTPRTPLLAGTKRAGLLAKGTIKERDIDEKTLREAAAVWLINAMIDIGEVRVWSMWN